MSTIKEFGAGDWVQALTGIREDDFRFPGDDWEHCQEGDVGHVMGIDGRLLIVLFERTGSTTGCYPEEVKRLCNFNASEVDRNFSVVSDPRFKILKEPNDK